MSVLFSPVTFCHGPRFSLTSLAKPLSISPSPCPSRQALVQFAKPLSISPSPCPSRQALVHFAKPLSSSPSPCPQACPCPHLASGQALVDLNEAREKKAKLSDAHTLLWTRPRKNAHLAAECYQFRQELFATKAKLEEQVKGEMSSMSTDSAKLG